MKLLKKTAVGQRRVYDIEVEDVHNFYANGINVHNCATAGGVSVIKDDGSVVDITGQTQAVLFVNFSESNELVTTGNYQDQYFVYAIPPTDILQNDATYRKRFYVFNASPAVLSGTALDLIDGYKGSSAGLTVLAEDQATPANGMVAYTTSTYNTGWMNGDIKGAFLSSTDTASLVGSGELVTNGDFATGDLTGWADPNSGWSVSGNAAVMALTGDYKPLTQDLGLSAGVPYVITFDVTAISGTMKVALDSSSPGISNTSANTFAATGTYSFTVVPESGETYIIFSRNSPTTSSVTIDNISVKLADADRSVNNKGLVVSGSITRSPVATGAELVAYSGFSASNYLEQPYNSALDFGTGDFCVMGWVKSSGAADDYIMDCRNSTTSGTGFFIYVNSGGFPIFYTQEAGSSTYATSSVALRAGGWQHFAAVRSSGALSIYLDGILVGNASGTSRNVSHASRVLTVGISVGLFGYHAIAASLALFRISATAPTPDQIAKIYNDEKVLFQDNAACTLYGTSDAVTALAHDEDTGLLHVGTSAGRSVFQGLRRVSNTTTAVGTAISASNGLVVEE